MLSKKYRLSRLDFLRVRTQGKSAKHTHFTARLLPNNLGFNRYSIVTSSKLSKSAVVRNRLRRHIYDQLKTNNEEPGLDIIIFPFPSMLNLTDEEYRSVLDSFLSKISQPS